MTTRNVTATILKTNGTALAGGTVKFIIDNNKTGVTVSPADLYPPTELEFTTDANGRLNGATGVALWANAEGLTRTHYRCTLPSGNTFPFTLPAGGTVIDLADLKIAGTTLVDLGDPIIAVIDARIGAIGGGVTSAFGRVGVVVATQDDYSFAQLSGKPTTLAGYGITSLNNVDNTSDANKPVSTAQQTALNLKANLASPTFTGTVLMAALTQSGQYINSFASALSTPAGTFTGAWIKTGGTATTTKPHFLIEETGASSGAWGTTGTGLGVNCVSGTPNLLDLQNNGVSKLKVDSTGQVTATSSISAGTSLLAASGIYPGGAAKSTIQSQNNSQLYFSNAAVTGFSALSLGPIAAPSTIGAVPTHAQGISFLQAEELLTIAAAATTTTTMQVPAGAVVMSVSVRVTTVIPTAATFTVKIGATTFSTAAVSTAANSTDVGTAAGAFYNATAGGVIITPNLTPGAATGVVRVTVSYILITPSTS